MPGSWFPPFLSWFMSAIQLLVGLGRWEFRANDERDGERQKERWRDSLFRCAIVFSVPLRHHATYSWDSFSRDLRSRRQLKGQFYISQSSLFREFLEISRIIDGQLITITLILPNTHEPIVPIVAIPDAYNFACQRMLLGVAGMKVLPIWSLTRFKHRKRIIQHLTSTCIPQFHHYRA